MLRKIRFEQSFFKWILLFNRIIRIYEVLLLKLYFKATPPLNLALIIHLDLSIIRHNITLDYYMKYNNFTLKKIRLYKYKT